VNGILQRIERQMESIREESQLRRIPPIENAKSRWMTYNGQRLLNLASNDYLGLANSPLLAQSAQLAIEKFGTSSGASRLVTGNNDLFTQLEQEMAEFKQQEAALVFNSGYSANLCILSSLANRNTLVFSDRLNHASIIDGIKLSGANQIRYRHNDMEHLAYLLEKHREASNKLIVSDSVFSMDGDLADLCRLVELSREHQCLLMVDEAHATGIFGQGRGLAHELGIEREIDLHMGTFSKALGSFGGYVAAQRKLVDYLINTGRAFIYTTGLPPATIAANLAAVRLVREDATPGAILCAKAKALCSRLNEKGIDTGNSASPIVPVILNDNERTLQVQGDLVAREIFVGAIRPPTVPVGTARLRIALRADLTDGEFDQLETTLLEAICN